MDTETNANKPLGSATLAGAEFEVIYYDVQGTGNQNEISKSDVDKLVSGATTSRTWKFKTDEEGKIRYTDNYKSSGDDLYKNSSGLYALPIGTVVIKETAAPTGYLNSNADKYWVREITGAGNSETVETYVAPDGDEAFKEQVKRGDITPALKIRTGEREGMKWELIFLVFVSEKIEPLSFRWFDFLYFDRLILDCLHECQFYCFLLLLETLLLFMELVLLFLYSFRFGN